MSLMVIAALFALYVSWSRSNMQTIIGIFSIILILMVSLILSKRLPDRVYHPMFGFLVISVLFLADRDLHIGKSFGSLVKLMLYFGAAAGLIVSISNQYTNCERITLLNRQFKQDISALHPRDDQLFIVWGAAFPYTRILPLDNFDYLGNMKLISLGTTLRTPITRARMKEYGVSDIYKALYEKDNVYLITNNDRHLYYYTEFIKEHYGADIQFRLAFKGNGFRVLNVFDETHDNYHEDAIDHKVITPYN